MEGARPVPALQSNSHSEKVAPSTGMPRTMYTVELKGPKGESKTIHISPFGHVMPFPVPQRQG